MTLVNKIAEIQIRLSNGLGIVAYLKNAVYVGAGMTIIFKLNITQSIITTLLALISFYILGYLDIKYFKLMQEVKKLSAGKYNPYFLQKLGKIERFK